VFDGDAERMDMGCGYVFLEIEKETGRQDVAVFYSVSRMWLKTCGYAF